jgi:poly(hydroxyalkanoate) depolymerase family esterase
MNRLRPLLLTLALAAMSTPADAQSAAAAPPAGSWEWHEYTAPAGARRYRLFVPARLPAGPRPLVVMLHGCTQDPDDFARGTRFNTLAAEAGVLVAWPEQPQARHGQKCWNWYDPAHQAAAGGEPALIAGITREVMAAHAVDPARVYLAGVSAGAAMAVNTAAAFPDLYAAVAAHSGVPYRAAAGVAQALAVMHGGSSDPAILAYALQDALGGRVLPLLAIHGAADAVLVPLNSRQLAGQWAGVLGLTASASEHGEEGGRGVERTRWRGADGTTRVELLLVEGLGHAWSGGSPEGSYTDPRGPNASRRVLDFLLAQHR